MVRENKKLPELGPNLSKDYGNSVSYTIYSEEVKDNVMKVLEQSRKSRESSGFSKFVQNELNLDVNKEKQEKKADIKI